MSILILKGGHMRNPLKNAKFYAHIQGEVFYSRNATLLHPKDVSDMSDDDKCQVSVLDFDSAVEFAHWCDSNKEMLDEVIQWHYKQWKTDRLKTAIVIAMMVLGALIGTGAFTVVIFIKWITPVSDPMVVFYHCMIIGAIGAMLSGFGAMLFNRQ